MEEDYDDCICGKSWGYMEEDGHKAVIGGLAVPLGIDDEVFTDALEEYAENKMKHTKKLNMWIIGMPVKSGTIRRES